VQKCCESPSNMIHKSWFVLTPTMEWYYKQKNHDYKPLAAFRHDCDIEGPGKQIELIYPEQNAKIYVPLEIDGSRGKTIFKAASRNPGSKIFWHLDDEYMGTTINFHQMAFSPAPGKHLLTIVDENGESISREFEILEKEK